MHIIDTWRGQFYENNHIEALIKKATATNVFVIINTFPSTYKTKNAGFGGLRFLTNTLRDIRNAIVIDR